MVEVIHEHGTDSGGNSIATVFGIILAIALIFFLFYYFGRGFLNSGVTQPQINVPDKVDVNVQQPGQ